MGETVLIEEKQSPVVGFSLWITKASQDETTGEMRWACVGSDTDPDLANDEMSLELFKSFVDRINAKELAPEKYRSDYWQGGMPYLSLSHYSDLGGKAVPGVIESVYIDGNRLKSKGIFSDTPLGKACFVSVKDSVIKHKSKAENFLPVRISIGFLDYKHEHKSNNFVFERKGLNEVCPECVLEKLRGEYSGKRYLDGLLIHEALTRVPMNTRTSMEVDKSMVTQKDDALSIVGDEELLEDIIKADVAEVDKAMVTKAEKKVEEDDEEEDEEEYPDKKKKKVEKSGFSVDEIALKVAEILRAVTPAETVVDTVSTAHPLDAVIAEFKSAYDMVDKSKNEELAKLTPMWEKLAEVVKSSFALPVVDENEKIQKMIDEAVTKATAPLLEELKTKSVAKESSVAPPVQRGLTHVPSLSNLVVNDPANIQKSMAGNQKPISSISEAINRSVGLPADFINRREVKTG